MKFVTKYICLAMVAFGLTGCATLFAPQSLSENYSLMPGAESNHPAFIDGNLKTAGETTFPERASSNNFARETPPSEAFVLLPEPKRLTKVVIHSDEVLGLDLFVEDDNQGWQLEERFDGLKGPVVELDINGIVYASGVKIRVRTSAGDKAARRENVRRGEGVTFIQGETRAPAKIYEIELFGPALADGSGEESSSSTAEM